jgi:septum formation protein
MKKDFELILASQSPRRQELLADLGFDFTIRTLPVEEKYPDELPKSEVAVFLAKLKAHAQKTILKPNELVISSDTIVLIDGEILGKPSSFEEGKSMLKKLSANKHQVITGVCLLSTEKEICFSDSTQVIFNHLRESEIEHYLNKYQPYDKAGSYGIQEWIGMLGVQRIEGSYFNVMGFPVHKVYQELLKF